MCKVSDQLNLLRHQGWIIHQTQRYRHNAVRVKSPPSTKGRAGEVADSNVVGGHAMISKIHTAINNLDISVLPNPFTEAMQ